MTRGISSSQMQILPACYFKLIPNNSDLGHLSKKTENPQYFFTLALIPSATQKSPLQQQKIINLAFELNFNKPLLLKINQIIEFCMR